jgi:predicted GNAT family N-acyltransferase
VGKSSLLRAAEPGLDLRVGVVSERRHEGRHTTTQVSLHALAFDRAGRLLGTGRLLPDGHVGRMAVLPQARGTGVGSALLAALLQAARARGDREVALSAQTHAIPFYERFGFVAEGEEYDDAGIPHRRMRRAL